MSSAASRKVRIVNDLGLHLRAAGILTQAAGQFQSEIWIVRQEIRANAKSIMSVLSLAASKGAELSIHADGEDAEQAVEEIGTLVERGFEPA